MSLPTNRDVLRNTLRSSLSDVLLDLGMDNRSNGIGVTTGRSFGSSLQQSSGCRGSALSGAFDAPLLPSRNQALVAQSFGISLPSHASPFLSGTSGLGAEGIMLAAAAAASERSKLLELAKASLIQRKLNEESKRLLIQQSYLNLIKEMSSHKAPPTNIPLVAAASNKHVAPASAAQPINGEKALEVLGTSLRTKTDPYIDVAELKGPNPDDTTLRRTRGGVSEPFPEKLHRMLNEVEEKGLSDVVSFYSHGRAFGVHDIDRFVAEVMPHYFKQSKWNSFARQLNLYGFVSKKEKRNALISKHMLMMILTSLSLALRFFPKSKQIRITSGPDAGGYYHELFLRGRPNLSLHMRRVGVPQGEDRRKFRPKNVNVEPDFYSMKKVTTDGTGTIR